MMAGIDGLGNGGELAGMRLHKVDNGDGLADVYVATPNIVTMTNDNVETSGYPGGIHTVWCVRARSCDRLAPRRGACGRFHISLPEHQAPLLLPVGKFPQRQADNRLQQLLEGRRKH